MAKDKYDKPSWGDKVILGILKKRAKKKANKAAYAKVEASVKKTTSATKKAPTTPSKPLSSTRTQQITGQLRSSGLTEAEINRLRGKKK